MKLIDNWRHAWRLWSVRLSAFGALLTALAAAAPDTLLQIWNGLPEDVRSLLPESVAHVIPTLLFVATIVARLIPQKPAAERQSLWNSISGKVAPKAAGGIAAAALAMIASVIAVEGGYVNHPADPGGETHMGITKVVAIQNGYTGPMRTLPREVAESIYYRRYLIDPGYAALVPIDAAVTEELFDTTVNMGSARPSRWFQASTNAVCGTTLTVDGRVGPGTIAAYRACQSRIGAANLCAVTLDQLDAAQGFEYARLVCVNPKLKVFYKGWIAHRVGNVDRAKCQAVVT
ncbi:glycosyl hydrolase 108 family protein [Sphingomonas sp. H160509]|uniref:glycoside hydrolase family 108 protein n=1 Tax=Sphingomonas sp. H160509 TaxID=2955313 RepID=UPI002098598E|nr:glycosyl hydrolase 108 family protein [Sphingomonas sp. H160509]MDD1450806.1 glycosyl hydrolase 108 family protein [Sphingomonas sp. H160509]